VLHENKTSFILLATQQNRMCRLPAIKQKYFFISLFVINEFGFYNSLK
jgi:hypothetical protein